MAGTVPDATLINQVVMIETGLINLYRSLQAITPISATANMASVVQSYVAINSMLSSMITNGPT